MESGYRRVPTLDRGLPRRRASLSEIVLLGCRISLMPCHRGSLILRQIALWIDPGLSSSQKPVLRPMLPNRSCDVSTISIFVLVLLSSARPSAARPFRHACPGSRRLMCSWFAAMQRASRSVIPLVVPHNTHFSRITPRDEDEINGRQHEAYGPPERCEKQGLGARSEAVGG
jgi:hypothetical protein